MSPTLSERTPLFVSSGRKVVSLTSEDAPALLPLLLRCGDYYDLVEGRTPTVETAAEELTGAPPERSPHDVFAFGILDQNAGLVGVIGALRNHRRANQWYLGLMLLDPALRGRGLGSDIYRGFEAWVKAQAGDSIVLAVVEANVRAARFWEGAGFGWPRSYPERTIGLKRHVLIEYEKAL